MSIKAVMLILLIMAHLANFVANWLILNQGMLKILFNYSKSKIIHMDDFHKE